MRRSGSANIRTDMEGARENIMAAVGEAAGAAGVVAGALEHAVAVLGLAGGNVGDYSVRLKALLPFRRSVIVNDGIIAMHGALGAHDGVIAIVGTGSVFVSRRGERVRSIGGWGFQVGDLGGGARLGRQLLEEVLLAHDGVRPASALTGKVMAMFDNDPRKIVDQVRDATPGLYGSFAPLLVEAGAAATLSPRRSCRPGAGTSNACSMRSWSQTSIACVCLAGWRKCTRSASGRATGRS